AASPGVVCINYDYVELKEGAKINEGYVPASIDKNGKLQIIGTSGVTVGSGVDLGATDLKRLGLSKDLYDKLEPYTKLSKDDVVRYLNAYPDPLQQRQLANYAKKQEQKRLAEEKKKADAEKKAEAQ